MTLVSRIDTAPLSVLLDVRSPASYLALAPAAELASDLEIGVNWLPLVSPPLHRPSTPAPDDDRGTRHRRFRAQAIAREIDTYAKARGLVVRDYYRDPDPAPVNLGWLWVRERYPDRLLSFLGEVLRAYWALDLDPSDPAAVAALVSRLDADPEEFLAWREDDGPTTAALLASELRERGLFGVPCYLVENEVFLGRQHLPMIRWILSGRAGPGPI